MEFDFLCGKINASGPVTSFIRLQKFFVTKKYFKTKNNLNLNNYLGLFPTFMKFFLKINKN
ncbi:hypothetical protein DR097_03620 [Mycoplasma hyopneumoniae]|nr:hypothetical protein [Mesomycoplasma hyopneumoniae]